MLQNIFNSIDIGHVILIITTLTSGLYNIHQRKHLRKQEIEDRRFEKKHAVYSKFILKLDEIARDSRPSLDSILNAPENHLAKMILAQTEEETINSFLGFNNHMISYMDKALEPILVLNTEINSLYLDCSDEMITLVKEFKVLASKLHDDTAKIIKISAPQNIEDATMRWGKVVQDNNWAKMSELALKMITQMRKDLQSN